MIIFATVTLLGCTSSEKPDTAEFVFTGPNAEMFQTVKDLADRTEMYNAGEWQEHFGDGALFGPSFDLTYADMGGEDRHYHRGIEALDFNREFVAEVSDNLLAHNDELEIVAMSLLSLTRAGSLLGGDDEYVTAVEPLLSNIDNLSAAMGDYFNLSAGEFAVTSYGPTAVSALMVMTQIEQAASYPEANPEYHLERAEEMLMNIHAIAWSDELGAYRFAPEDDRLMLYPNITMMTAWARLYELTNDPLHIETFYDIYQGIQPLKDEDGDHYHSPYSYESMGATDKDYSTLSSQNYLMLGLLSAHQATGDTQLLAEVDLILSFIEDNLMEDGLITHHWIDGRAASHDDPWYFCMGCNLQTLYILLVRNALQ